MHILETLPRGRPHSQLNQKVSPEEVHAVEHERHHQQVFVLETDQVPLVLGCGLVRVDVGQ
jgi:hypothetical protein